MIFKNLTFDGISLKEYGVYISGEAVFDSPTRDVEMVTIPGRNGSFVLDKGRFNNITVTYPAGIYATSQTEFAEKVSTLRNLLASRKGYCRLTDEYNPDEFRLGVYKAGLELDPTHYNEAGRFELSFDCKPQRFLFSGEEVFTLGEWGQTETKSGSVVSFEGDETTAIKSLTAQIVPKQSGSGDPSPSNVRPISGWSEVNIYDDTKYAGSIVWNQLCLSPTRASGSFGGLTYTNNADGTFTINGTATATDFYTICTNTATPTNGHKYLLMGCSKDGSGQYWLGVGGNNADDSGNGSIFTYGSGRTNLSVVFKFVSGAKFTNVEFTPQLFDLTLMFGAGNEPTTVEAFKELFTKDYYTYNAGTSTCVSAVNGDPYRHYPISLGQTVYGGTLDVVSGKLVIDMVTVDLGSLTWNKNSTYNIFTAWLTPQPMASTPTKDGYAVLPNYLYSPNFVLDSSKDKVCEIGRTGYFINNLIIRDTSYTDATAFKTAMSGKVGAYKTATPIAELTLTPTEVKTLLGANNIWADSGDVTVEIGQNPYILVNPTLFEACPLIEFNSSGADGEINLGNRQIKVLNSYIGNIPLNLSANNNEVTINNTSSFNSGDIIKFNGVIADVVYASNGQSWLPSTTARDGLDSTAYLSGEGGWGVTLKSSEMTFTAGTSSTVTQTATIKIDQYIGSGTETRTFTLTVAYDGTDKFTITWTIPAYTNFPTYRTTDKSNYVGSVNSTKSSLEDVDIYIDLDIGEAYSVDSSDNVVSLNNFVNLGGELPTLDPGATEISTDESISNVKVTPRWWKV